MYGFYKTTLIGALVAACSVLLSTAIIAEPRSTPQPGENDSIVLPTSSKGILSQCGDYYTFQPDKQYYGVVPENYDKDYTFPSMIVPVWGYMANKGINIDEATNQEFGTNPYSPPEINRTLWDGHTIIWVEKKADVKAYASIHDYAEKWNKVHEKKVIVLTWTGARPLPLGRSFGFSSWSISQSCTNFSESVFEEFLQKAQEHNAGRDIQPLPMATLTADGSLQKIPVKK